MSRHRWLSRVAGGGLFLAAAALWGQVDTASPIDATVQTETTISYHRVVVGPPDGGVFSSRYPDVLESVVDLDARIGFGSFGTCSVGIGLDAGDHGSSLVGAVPDSGAYQLPIGAGVRELSWSSAGADALSMRIGIRPVAAPFSLYLDQADFIGRYTESTNLEGLRSFPTVDVGLYAGQLFFDLMFIPYLGKATAYDGALRLYNDAYPGSMVSLSGSASIQAARIKIAGYLGEGEPWSLRDLYGAVAGEAQVPVMDWLILEGQGMLSSGLGPYGLVAASEGGPLFLSRIAGRATEAFLDLSFAVRLTLFDQAELALFYAHDGRGLGQDDWNAARGALASLIAVGDSTSMSLVPSYVTLARYPLLIVRDRLGVGLVVPSLMEGVSLSSIINISTLDWSGQAYLRLGVAAGDSMEVSLDATASFGASPSQFMLSEDRLVLGLSLSIRQSAPSGANP